MSVALAPRYEFLVFFDLFFVCLLGCYKHRLQVHARSGLPCRPDADSPYLSDDDSCTDTANLMRYLARSPLRQASKSREFRPHASNARSHRVLANFEPFIFCLQKDSLGSQFPSA